jgi:predicted RNase H-like HicB family nuclease
MKKNILKAIITGGKDQFGAWIENVPGVYGAGDTVEETKDNLLEAIELLKEEGNKFFSEPYEIEFAFDTSGFLKYYSKYISFAGMKEITGINQKQLWSYAAGYRNPSKETSEKIFNRIQEFSKEISQVHFSF